MHTIVQGAGRQIGGAWQQYGDLSLKGRNAQEPDVGIDSAGNATALWSRHDGSKYIVQAATRIGAGGAWGPAVDLSAAGESAEEPQLAVNAAGDAVAVWTRFNGTRDIVQAATRSGSGGAWGPAMDLSEAGQDAEEPEVAIDPAGTAVVVWRRYDGTKFVIQARRKPAGGGWEPTLPVSVAGQNAEEPRVAIDAGGTAVAVWSRFDGARLAVQSSTQSAGGAWSPPVDLSAAGENANEPAVAVDPAGNAVAVWARENMPTKRIQSSTRPVGGSWEPAATLSDAGDSAEEPDVAIDPAGRITAVWSRTDGSPRVIESSSRDLSGSWQQPPQVISVIGQNAAEPDAAADPSGDRVVVWSRENGANAIVQAAALDAAGPLMRSLSIPAAGTVRQQLTFSISPFDVWSPLGTIVWDMGDLLALPGASVSHAYRLPGVYAVSVTATDELNSSSTVGGQVRIYPKPRSGRNVRVRRGRAILRLYCPSPAGCEGLLRLVAPTEIDAQGKPKGKRRQIGRARFEIPGARATNLPVRLTRAGRDAAAETGRKGLKAQLTGPGVKHRVVVLFALRG